MQNCLQFNAADSDIVKEARRQALSMPGLLRNAAMKHNLFISEDGNVFEIHSDDEKEGDGAGDGADSAATQRKSRKNVRKRVLAKDQQLNCDEAEWLLDPVRLLK